MSRRCSKSRGPSGHATSAPTSSSESPEVTKSTSPPPASTVVITPWVAPVSARALSTTSRSTVSRSRLELMRSTVPLSRAKRSLSDRFSRLSSPRSFKGPLPSFTGGIRPNPVITP